MYRVCLSQIQTGSWIHTRWAIELKTWPPILLFKTPGTTCKPAV